MREARTLLAQKIVERRQTYEEFAEYAERFAREHDEPGTLGVRHLCRLATGRGPNGCPPGPVRPATARLLEHIFDTSIEQLLAPPRDPADETSALREMLQTSRRVDRGMVAALRSQLHHIRRLDRQLGARVAHDEVQTKAWQVTHLLTHCIGADARRKLARLVSELSTLAGWQALDLGNPKTAWQWYDHATSTALASESMACIAYARGEQALVLIDIGDHATAVEILAGTREQAKHTCRPTLRAWLAAAHGEALATSGDHDNSLRAFDTAARLISSDNANDGPYIQLEGAHLDRWRGHALAATEDPEATMVLRNALQRHDATFTRAEAALRTDLAIALATTHDHGAALDEAKHARRLSAEIGSVRQQRRIDRLLLKASPGNRR